MLLWGEAQTGPSSDSPHIDNEIGPIAKPKDILISRQSAEDALGLGQASCDACCARWQRARGSRRMSPRLRTPLFSISWLMGVDGALGVCSRPVEASSGGVIKSKGGEANWTHRCPGDHKIRIFMTADWMGGEIQNHALSLCNAARFSRSAEPV
jgi:hypothetical protein